MHTVVPAMGAGSASTEDASAGSASAAGPSLSLPSLAGPPPFIAAPPPAPVTPPPGMGKGSPGKGSPGKARRPPRPPQPFAAPPPPPPVHGPASAVTEVSLDPDTPPMHPAKESGQPALVAPLPQSWHSTRRQYYGKAPSFGGPEGSGSASSAGALPPRDDVPCGGPASTKGRFAGSSEALKLTAEGYHDLEWHMPPPLPGQSVLRLTREMNKWASSSWRLRLHEAVRT